MSAPEQPSPAPALRVPWRRTLLGLTVGLALATGAMVFLRISGRDLLKEISRPLVWPLLFSAAGSLVLLAFQSLRWWLVMRPVVRLRYREAYAAMAVGFFFNVFVPVRGGDLLRVQYLGKWTGTSRAKLLGTEIVDLCSDKWGWVAAFPLVCLLGAPPSWLFKALGLLAALVAAGAAVLALMGSKLWRNSAKGSRGPAWLGNLRDGFAAQQWKQLLLVETVVAPLPWLWETLLIAVAGRALGLSLSPMEAFAVLTAFNLALVVPSPGNLGSLESAGTLALVQFGVAKPTALAFMFLYHMTQVLPGVALGGAILVAHGKHLFRTGYGSARQRATTNRSIDTATRA